MAGTWTTLANAPTFSAGTMLLLTDGSILCHDEPNSGGVTATTHWWRLVPDALGSYINGTWHQVADGPNSPLYFVCSVLRDGRVFIAGGEYNGTNSAVELLAAEVYDPRANAWTTVGTPAGWTQIGDAPSAVLADGRVLVGAINTNRSAIFDPTTLAWTAAANKDDTRGTEETWILLPDQSVLAIECDRRPRTEKYIPAADAWVSAGNTPVTLVDAASLEIGAALALPDGRVFCIGATNHTALYTAPPLAQQPGTWAAGPDFPVLANGKVTGAKDAPAALLPSGRVLCVVSPYTASNSGDFGTGLFFYEYDPVGNTLTSISAPANAGGAPFSSRLMLLPNGQVLHTNGTTTVAVYTPDGAPDPMWRPSITSAPSSVRPGFSYTLHGRQLNGLSQAVIYGDEGAMATNYPIVKITHAATGHITYCRTHDHSTMGINTGTVVHSTRFDVPSGIDQGPSWMTVIANGIESDPHVVAVHTKNWKELKIEIKEIKENIKWEHEGVKLVFEDKRKDNEGDWRERLGDVEWGETMRHIIERSDQLETELRSLDAFITRKERPEVGRLARAATHDEEPVAAAPTPRQGDAADKHVPKSDRSAGKSAGRSAGPSAGKSAGKSAAKTAAKSAGKAGAARSRRS